jgi:hypothetical protein
VATWATFPGTSKKVSQLGETAIEFLEALSETGHENSLADYAKWMEHVVTQENKMMGDLKIG